MRPRFPALAVAAVLLVIILPVVADGPGARPTLAPAIALSSAVPDSPLPASSTRADSQRVLLTGTLVCLQCETRHEAGLCPLPESHHDPGFCADNGEVWRLMFRDPAIAQASVGQTVTIEGVGFPRSGFLRASRVGY